MGKGLEVITVMKNIGSLFWPSCIVDFQMVIEIHTHACTKWEREKEDMQWLKSS